MKNLPQYYIDLLNELEYAITKKHGTASARIARDRHLKAYWDVNVPKELNNNTDYEEWKNNQNFDFEPYSHSHP